MSSPLRTIRALVVPILLIPALAPMPLLAASAEASVSLEQILEHADQHAPLLRLARTRARGAQAEIEAASPLLREHPELELTHGPSFGSGAGVGGARGRETEVSLTLAVGVFGQRGLRKRAARDAQKVAQTRLEATRWDIHRQVHEAYHDALLAQTQVGATRRVLDFATHLEEITRQQLQAGEVSQVELRLARGELGRARQALIAAEGDARRAQLRLAGVAGWPITSPPRVAGQLDGPHPVPSLDELLERADGANPALSVAAAEAEGARTLLALADRERWPDPRVGLHYGQERDPGETESLHRGLVSLGIPLPFWNPNRGERARARADLELAEAEQEVIQALTRTRIADAHTGVEVAVRRIVAFGEGVLPDFEGNLDLLERAFELGEIDLLEVMVARGRFLEIELEALAAYESYFASVAKLEATLGAEVWPDETHHQEVSP